MQHTHHLAEDIHYLINILQHESVFIIYVGFLKL